MSFCTMLVDHFNFISFFRQFFTAKVFAKLLHTDSYGRISIMQFFNYVMRKGDSLCVWVWTSVWDSSRCWSVLFCYFSHGPCFFPVLLWFCCATYRGMTFCIKIEFIILNKSLVYPKDGGKVVESRDIKSRYTFSLGHMCPPQRAFPSQLCPVALVSPPCWSGCLRVVWKNTFTQVEGVTWGLHTVLHKSVLWLAIKYWDALSLKG